MIIIENTYELLAINTPINSKYKRQRFAQYDNIAIDDNGEIDINSDYSTHLIIGIYSTVASTHTVLILIDVIDNTPLVYELL